MKTKRSKVIYLKKMNNNGIYFKFLSIAAAAGILIAGFLFIQSGSVPPITAQNYSLDEQSASISAIKKIKPAVVSIIIYAKEDIVSINVVSGERTTSRQSVKKGSGTGFLISPDGLILTNKHVINSADDKAAEYRIILNSGKEYYAQLIGRDPVNDLAVLKIFDKNLPCVELGDSDKLEQGMSVMAIGNALGELQNSVTKGIVSGLGRSIVASDLSGNSEALDNVIQTDAGINLGNSGGPLIDLNGKVIGINTALADTSQSIGFAIPINDARMAIRTVKENGRIIRPRIGIRYIMLTTELARDKGLPVNEGAWIDSGDSGEPAIVSGSPAQKAGLLPGDIILEVNGIKLGKNLTLRSLVQRYKAGDRIGLRIIRDGKITVKVVVLDEFK